MNLPSKIKGWLSTAQVSLLNTELSASPEQAMAHYIATGKKQYLTLIIKAFNQTLFHYIVSQSDKPTAEDVIQTTWLKVMKTETKVAPTHIKSWLFTIARNTLIDELRKQNRWQHIEFTDELSEQMPATQSVEQVIEKESQLTQFNQALLALPFLQREAFILQQEGFSITKISELTNSTHETIKSRLRYARKMLKNIIGNAS